MQALVDPYGRRVEYLRLSVTDRCDFRCTYCIPKGYKGFVPPATWLSAEEIERVVRCFAELGVSRVRLTGGEPLVRRDVLEIARRLGAVPGVRDLSLSTNGSRLADLAADLRAAGVARINVSLDTLDAAVFHRLTGGDLDAVLAGLAAARRVGLQPIKINMVVLRGVNDHEVDAMLNLCQDKGFTLRLIESMPLGAAAESAADQYVDLAQVEAGLRRRHPLRSVPATGGGPARYVQLVDKDVKVGFITPISQHFCETCNRVRLSPTGRLYLCLGQEHSYDLGVLLKSGGSDAELRAAILEAIARKPERHEFQEQPGRITRLMAETGG